MPQAPRIDLFTRICAGLVAAPAALSAVAGMALVLTADRALAGPAGLGAAMGIVGGLPLLVVEYRAIIRRSRRAAAFVGYLTLYLAAMGSIAWLAGLLSLLRRRPAGPNSMSPAGFAAYSIFLAGLVTAGWGHLRWRRLLRAGSSGAIVR